MLANPINKRLLNRMMISARASSDYTGRYELNRDRFLW